MKTLTIRTVLFGMALAIAAALLPPTASAASPNLFASVAGNGTLVNGNGVSSVTHIGTGQYEVTFTSDVSGCAYVSTTQNAFSQALQRLHDDRHSRLGQQGRSLHPGHNRDHARLSSQHQRNPGPAATLLRRCSDQPVVPRRGNLLTLAPPFRGARGPAPGHRGFLPWTGVTV